MGKRSDSIRQKIYEEQARGCTLRREWHKKEVRQRRSRECVYFIRCERFVKIGYSSAPLMRLDSLRTANPFPCVLLGTIPGGSKIELQLHNEFAQYRHQGEWFHFTRELSERIANLLGIDSASNVIQLTPKVEATA